jgi:hypothetical protein
MLPGSSMLDTKSCKNGVLPAIGPRLGIFFYGNKEYPSSIRNENHDGLPEIWVLFSQGDEGIFLFVNKGNSKFEQEQIFGFNPYSVLHILKWQILIKMVTRIFCIPAVITPIIQPY